MPPRIPAVDLDRALDHLARHDSRLRDLVRRCPAPVLGGRGSAFSFLARAVVYQQLSGRVAAVIFRRLRRLFRRGRLTPAAMIAVPSGELRAAGLSERKASCLKDLAASFANGTVRPRQLPFLDDDAVSRQLMRVRGIGQWTADAKLQ